MTASDDQIEGVPITRLLRGWAVIMLLVTVSTYLFGGDNAFETVVSVLIPATVVVSFGLLAWRYGLITDYICRDRSLNICSASAAVEW
jgi:hypothetical protein